MKDEIKNTAAPKPKRKPGEGTFAKLQVYAKAQGYNDAQAMIDAIHGAGVLSVRAIAKRIGHDGLDLIAAINKPKVVQSGVGKTDVVKQWLADNGYSSMTDAARDRGVNNTSAQSRLASGLHPDEAFDPDFRVALDKTNVLDADLAAFVKSHGCVSVAELCRKVGMIPNISHHRIRRGATFPQAFGFEPYGIEVEINGKRFASLDDACKHNGISVQTIYGRARKANPDMKGAEFKATMIAELVKAVSAKRAVKAKVNAEKMPDPVVFGWRFRSWAAVIEYWHTATMRNYVMPQARDKLLKGWAPDKVFGAARKYHTERGNVDDQGRRKDEENLSPNHLPIGRA